MTSLDTAKWIHGAPDCSQSTDPPIQVHHVDGDSIVLRLSKCYSFEGNFIC
jgi:hydroxyacylglutathione hydrolase